MAYDFLTAVLDKLVAVYTAELQTAIATSDALRLNLIEKAPLQEDITEVAPFVVVSIDNERGRILDPVHEDETGTGLKWMNHFVVVGRIPLATTKNSAYTNIGTLLDRMIRATVKYWNLSGLVADNAETVYASDPHVIDKTGMHVIGGDNEWYGECRLNLHYFSQQPGSVFGI